MRWNFQPHKSTLFALQVNLDEFRIEIDVKKYECQPPSRSKGCNARYDSAGRWFTNASLQEMHCLGQDNT